MHFNMNNTIKINDYVFNEDEIKQLLDLVAELLNTNEELNARCIAFNAKLSNEESKVKKLQQELFFISQAFTNNTYKA